MAHDNDLLLNDDETETEEEEEFQISTNREKIDARRRLEEYMEMKKLRELTEF